MRRNHLIYLTITIGLATGSLALISCKPRSDSKLKDHDAFPASTAESVQVRREWLDQVRSKLGEALTNAGELRVISAQLQGFSLVLTAQSTLSPELAAVRADLDARLSDKMLAVLGTVDGLLGDFISAYYSGSTPGTTVVATVGTQAFRDRAVAAATGARNYLRDQVQPLGLLVIRHVLGSAEATTQAQEFQRRVDELVTRIDGLKTYFNTDIMATPATPPSQPSPVAARVIPRQGKYLSSRTKNYGACDLTLTPEVFEGQLRRLAYRMVPPSGGSGCTAVYSSTCTPAGTCPDFSLVSPLAFDLNMSSTDAAQKSTYANYDGNFPKSSQLLYDVDAGIYAPPVDSNLCHFRIADVRYTSSGELSHFRMSAAGTACPAQDASFYNYACTGGTCVTRYMVKINGVTSAHVATIVLGRDSRTQFLNGGVDGTMYTKAN